MEFQFIQGIIDSRTIVVRTIQISPLRGMKDLYLMTSLMVYCMDRYVVNPELTLHGMISRLLWDAVLRISVCIHYGWVIF